MLSKPFASPYLTSGRTASFCSPLIGLSALSLNVGVGGKSSCITRKGCHKFLSSAGNWKLKSSDQNQVSIVLDDKEKMSWEQCKNLLSAFNFTDEEVSMMLKKAFGWAHSPYWGEERDRQVPDSDSVNEMLDYLKNLSISDEDLHKLLKKFPEVLGCDLDGEVKTNIGILEKEWGIKGKSLRSLLLRNPKVLGYNVDCKGDCMAQCTRCWLHYVDNDKECLEHQLPKNATEPTKSLLEHTSML